MTDTLTRIAIINPDRCKPTKCRQECAKVCPPNRLGKLCIEAKPNSKHASISEVLCIGCGLCVKKCPFNAIEIINLPKNLEAETIHRYGNNGFKLHRLPIPRPNEVLGLVGSNGTGKSTALKILSGKIKPNLGSDSDWVTVINHFKGSELQTYFTKLVENDMKVTLKPQNVEMLARVTTNTVEQMIMTKDERGIKDKIMRELDLVHIKDKNLKDLSGGELQRVAIAATICTNSDVYIFDEPSSFLDVKQRIQVSKAIRSLIGTRETVYIIVVEHDLAVLDYLSDYICVLYGVPGAYGVVTHPFSVREGINHFLAGWIPTENLRMREYALSFNNTEVVDRENMDKTYNYPTLTKSYGEFQLTVQAGKFTNSEIVIILGENGTGKSTLIKMLAGKLKSDNGEFVPNLKVSYKPQLIVPKFEGTVRELLNSKVGTALKHPQFQTDVYKPLDIERLLDQQVKTLSGGEIQRVAITIALGTPADLYLIDEPSAYLDSEQRLIVGRAIKRFIMHSMKTAFVIEHDMLLAQYLANSVIVLNGAPGKTTSASTPLSLTDGMNSFLQELDVTYRRDPSNHRPRINKYGSQQDREQKELGSYFNIDI